MNHEVFAVRGAVVDEFLEPQQCASLLGMYRLSSEISVYSNETRCETTGCVSLTRQQTSKTAKKYLTLVDVVIWMNRTFAAYLPTKYFYCFVADYFIHIHVGLGS